MIRDRDEKCNCLSRNGVFYVVKHPLGHNRPYCPSFPAHVSGWACFLLLFCAGYLTAADLPAPVTLDLPIPANLATPAWLGHPETPAAVFATLNIPLQAPDPNAALLVTVYFQEQEGGFMRISWLGTTGAQVLSDNFYENIGMANQRSLLIPASALTGDGSLSFQCGGSTLGIQRIKLEWLASESTLVSPTVQDLMVTPSTGPTQPALTLNGQVNPAEPGAWDDQIVTVPLTDEPLRIEKGVDFSVDLDKVPNSGRLALKVSGLAMGKRLIVWINDQRAGTITPDVPALQDDGFLNDASDSSDYVGWRDGSFFVPVSLLKEGVNTVQFSDEDDSTLNQQTTETASTGQDAPLAIKALTLQLNYTASPGSTTSPATTTATPDPDTIQPHLSGDPTGPILESLPTSSDTTDTPTPTTP
jgi:hypothetical protein